jgi:hypothetical protein
VAGKKVWAAGDVLAAADINDYLMDQAVMVFDSDAARTAGIGTATAGMVTFRTDGTALEVYNGSAWVSANSVGGTIAASLVTGTLTNGTVTSKNVAQQTYSSYNISSQSVTSSDKNELWIVDNPSAIGTVVFGTAAAFSTGDRLDIISNGTYDTKVISSGVTLYGAGTAGTAYTISKYEAASIVCVGSNSYRIIGNVTAV